MKKYAIAYILGIITVGLLSFQAGVSVTEYKPVKPISTVVVRDNEWRGWVMKGYQIQSVAAGSSGRELYVLVKY